MILSILLVRLQRSLWPLSEVFDIQETGSEGVLGPWPFESALHLGPIHF